MKINAHVPLCINTWRKEKCIDSNDSKLIENMIRKNIFHILSHFSSLRAFVRLLLLLQIARFYFIDFSQKLLATKYQNKNCVFRLIFDTALNKWFGLWFFIFKMKLSLILVLNKCSVLLRPTVRSNRKSNILFEKKKQNKNDPTVKMIAVC